MVGGGQVALRRVALQNYMLVAGDGGTWGDGEVGPCRRWKASATGKAHMKLNRKQDRKVRT